MQVSEIFFKEVFAYGINSILNGMEALWINLEVVEWGISIIATTLLVFTPDLAIGPLLISFLLYAPWVWGGAIWLIRRDLKN